MKNSTPIKVAAIAGIAALALTSCAANENASGTDTDTSSSLSGELVGAGSSAQGSAQDAWIAAFQTANDQVTINYDPSGSGAGRETFQQGGSQYAGSDAAFKLEDLSGEFAACATGSGIVEVPNYISPIAVVFNLDGIDSLNMDADTIAGIFAGKITKWNDSAIADQNPDADLPDAAITAVHRSDDSGTTENFTDYLSQNAASTWTAGAIQTWPKEYGGEGANQTSGVVDAVKNGTGTIGYMDASKSAGFGQVSVKVGETYVAHTPEGAAKAVELSPVEEGRGANDLAIELDRTLTDEGVYPIVLVSYLIGCEQYADAANAELVKSYFTYVTSAEGQQAAADAAGSAPLSAELSTKVAAAVSAIK